MDRTKGAQHQIYLAVDATGMPLRAIITKGIEVNCKQAASLIDDIPGKRLIADRG